MNANKKGKRFEREVAKLINKKFDTDCRRTPNSGGLSIKGDIIDLSGAMKDFHIECKHQESINIWKYLAQAEADARGKIPIVVFKKNFSDIYTVLKFDDLLNLIKRGDEAKEAFFGETGHLLWE